MFVYFDSYISYHCRFCYHHYHYYCIVTFMMIMAAVVIVIIAFNLCINIFYAKLRDSYQLSVFTTQYDNKKRWKKRENKEKTKQKQTKKKEEKIFSSNIKRRKIKEIRSERRRRRRGETRNVSTTSYYRWRYFSIILSFLAYWHVCFRLGGLWWWWWGE